MTQRVIDGRTVFVLGGGGALGAYQAGALLALLRRGVVPDVIYGASVGALNGAYLAHDPTAVRAESLLGWWTGTQAREVLAPGAWQRARGIAAALRGAEALFDERPLRRMIARHVGAHDIAELAVPLVVTTTCLDCARPVHHSQGAIADVLVASCALPGLFAPVACWTGIGTSMPACCAAYRCARLWTRPARRTGSSCSTVRWPRSPAGPAAPRAPTPARPAARCARSGLSMPRVITLPRPSPFPASCRRCSTPSRWPAPARMSLRSARE